VIFRKGKKSKIVDESEMFTELMAEIKQVEKELSSSTKKLC